MNETSGNLLKNAPLKEVIFELRWELEYVPQQNSFIDTGFEEAVMNFRTACHENFKDVLFLFPNTTSFGLLNHKVTHRFFKEKGKHPIYQMGPGVFTVNDNNKNYSWEVFKQLIITGIRYLKESYSKELVPSKVELRYIDAVSSTIFEDESKFDFLRENLNVNAESYPFVTGQLVDISFTKRFIVSEDAYLNLTVATGKDKNSNEDLIVWHTFVTNKERIVWERMEEWLEQAHLTCSETFNKMISKDLYEYFSR